MPVIFPQGVSAQGNVKVTFVPKDGIADPTAPTDDELNAQTAVDATFILQEGSWAPSAEANRGSAPRRLGSKKQFETFGTVTEGLADLVYVVNPQAGSGDDAKKLYELLAPGTELYAVERLGVDAEEDFAESDIVNVHPVKVGPQNVTGDTSDEFAEIVCTQPVAVTAPGVYRDVEVVAGTV